MSTDNGTGNGNALALTTGKLCREMTHTMAQTHLLVFQEINLELQYTGIKFSINTEYSPEYLKEAASKYAEIWQLDETTFVAGKGHRKSVQQRHYEKLKEYLLKLNVMKIKSAA